MTTSSSTVLTALTATLGEDIVRKIQSSKILLVGSGGIGCELIKNLTLSGFRHCATIDMDTIDVSNLNRQLLFRSQHVGNSKCEVASAVAMDMIGLPPSDADAAAATAENSGNNETTLQPLSYTAHYGNVCDNTKFNVHFVAQFDLVLNALDNVTARRRVNRLCLAAGVPLVEAGTTGYLGQVNVMDKASGVACYECTTQESQKVYPICTIRSTPSEPVHAIVWAKEFYKLCFADKLEESMLYEDPQGKEPSAYMAAVMELRALLKDPSKPKEELVPAAQAVMKALYVDEIQKQLDMDRYRAAKKTPAVLSAEVISTGTESATMDGPPPSQTKATDQLWTPVECVTETLVCLLEAKADPDSLLQAFDKDDDLAMRWVTATSNLRSHVFQITPLQSLYSTKGIAGNIIPAIATTNAIVAGLQVIQVFNILKAQLASGKKTGMLKDCCQYVNCVRQWTRNGLLLIASELNEPNSKCFVCRQATISLSIDTKKWTLETFLQRIVKKELGFEDPTLMLEDDIIWEEEQGVDQQAFVGNLSKTLDKLPCGGFQHGTVLEIEDFSQDLQVNVAIAQQEVWAGEEYDNPEQQFMIGGEKPKKVATQNQLDDATNEAAPAAAAGAGKPDENGDNGKKDLDEDDDSEIEIFDANPDLKPEAVKKRRSEENESVGPPSKRAKIEIIELD